MKFTCHEALDLDPIYYVSNFESSPSMIIDVRATYYSSLIVMYFSLKAMDQLYGRLSWGVTALSGLMMACASWGIAVFVNAQKVNSPKHLGHLSIEAFHQMIFNVKKESLRLLLIVPLIVKHLGDGLKQTIPGQMMMRLTMVCYFYSCTSENLQLSLIFIQSLLWTYASLSYYVKIVVYSNNVNVKC